MESPPSHSSSWARAVSRKHVVVQVIDQGPSPTETRPSRNPDGGDVHWRIDHPSLPRGDPDLRRPRLIRSARSRFATWRRVEAKTPRGTRIDKPLRISQPITRVLAATGFCCCHPACALLSLTAPPSDPPHPTATFKNLSQLIKYRREKHERKGVDLGAGCRPSNRGSRQGWRSRSSPRYHNTDTESSELTEPGHPANAAPSSGSPPQFRSLHLATNPPTVP